jgi:transglutaminase-like putative cysteine protease
MKRFQTGWALCFEALRSNQRPFAEAIARTVPTSLVIVFAILIASPLAARAQERGFTLLVDRETLVFDDDGRWVRLVELERKAHDPQSARNGGRVDLSYESSMHKLEVLEAATIKADGRRIKVPQDKIIDAAPQVSREIAIYTDLRTRSIVFPDVEAGDSIRWVYRLVEFDRTWPGFSMNVVWLSSARALIAERIIDAPASMRLDFEHHGVGYREETSNDRVRRTLSWSNPKPIVREAGAVSEFDWGARAAISTYASYGEIGDLYSRLHVEAANVTPVVSALATEIVGGSVDREAEARLLYDWVRRNIRYVSVQLGQGKLKPVSAEETLKNRYGDCKAIVALLSALLAARDIGSVPVLMDTAAARYSLPDVPVTGFNHVILHIPDLDRYVDATWHDASFAVLPWGHHGKPVLLAAAGKSRLARLPPERTEENVGEVHTTARISSAGRLSGTTREYAKGIMAADIRRHTSDLSPAKAKAQLQHFGLSGTGKWTKTAAAPSLQEVTLVADFELSEPIELAAGEPMTLPAGLRFSVRPGVFLVGRHEGERKHPFPCHAGRQLEVIQVALPPGFRPARLPADRHLRTAIAEFHSTYEFSKGVVSVRREFVSFPAEQVCQPELSRGLAEFLSSVGRDLRSMVILAAEP